MSLELAPRPFNEEIRAKTVISTGLIDSPEPVSYTHLTLPTKA